MGVVGVGGGCHKVTKDEPALLTMPPHKYRLCMSMEISSHISKELTQISYGICCQNMHSRYAADLGNENNALQKCISFLARIPFILCMGPPQKLSNNVVGNKSLVGAQS